jgi:hypothetical protein
LPTIKVRNLTGKKVSDKKNPPADDLTFSGTIEDLRKEVSDKNLTESHEEQNTSEKQAPQTKSEPEVLHTPPDAFANDFENDASDSSSKAQKSIEKNESKPLNSHEKASASQQEESLAPPLQKVATTPAFEEKQEKSPRPPIEALNLGSTEDLKPQLLDESESEAEDFSQLSMDSPDALQPIQDEDFKETATEPIEGLNLGQASDLQPVKSDQDETDETIEDLSLADQDSLQPVKPEEPGETFEGSGLDVGHESDLQPVEEPEEQSGNTHLEALNLGKSDDLQPDEDSEDMNDVLTQASQLESSSKKEDPSNESTPSSSLDHPNSALEEEDHAAPFEEEDWESDPLESKESVSEDPLAENDLDSFDSKEDTFTSTSDDEPTNLMNSEANLQDLSNQESPSEPPEDSDFGFTGMSEEEPENEEDELLSSSQDLEASEEDHSDLMPTQMSEEQSFEDDSSHDEPDQEDSSFEPHQNDPPFQEEKESHSDFSSNEAKDIVSQKKPPPHQEAPVRKQEVGELTQLQQQIEENGPDFDRSQNPHNQFATMDHSLYTYNPADEEDGFDGDHEGELTPGGGNLVDRIKIYVENNKKNVGLVGVAIILFVGAFLLMNSPSEFMGSNDKMMSQIPSPQDVPSSPSISKPSSPASPPPSSSSSEEVMTAEGEAEAIQDPRLLLDSSKSVSDPVENFFISLESEFNRGDPKSLALALSRAPKKDLEGEMHRLFVSEASARFFLTISDPLRAKNTLEPYCHEVSHVNGPQCVHFIRSLISLGEYEEAHRLLGSAIAYSEDVSSQWNLVKREVEILRASLFALYTKTISDVRTLLDLFLEDYDLHGEWARQRTIWFGSAVLGLSPEERYELSHDMFVSRRDIFQNRLGHPENAYYLGEDPLFVPLFNFLAFENEVRPLSLSDASPMIESKIHAAAELFKILVRLNHDSVMNLVSDGRNMKKYHLFREVLALIHANLALEEGEISLVRKIIAVNEIIDVKSIYTNNPDILSYQREQERNKKQTEKVSSKGFFSFANYFDFLEKEEKVFPLEWILSEGRFALHTRSRINMERTQLKVIDLLNKEEFLYVFDLWIMLAEMQRELGQDAYQSLKNARQLAKTPRQMGFVLSEELRYFAKQYLTTPHERELIEMVEKANEAVPYHMALSLTTAEILGMTGAFDPEEILGNSQSFPEEYVRRGHSYVGVQPNTLKAILNYL